MQTLLIAILALAALPSVSRAQSVVINNGFAPPNTTNVIDDNTYSGTSVYVRDVGCPPGWPESGTADNPCPSPGGPTIVELTDGGAIAFPFVRDNSTLTITGGETGEVRAEDSSTVIMSGGSLNLDLVARDSAVVTVNEGTIGSSLISQGSSSVTFSGGSVGSSLIGSDFSTVTMTGGSAAGLDIHGSAHLEVSGGTVSGNSLTAGNSIVTISGGRLEGNLIADSAVAIGGGTLNGDLHAHDAVTINGGAVMGELFAFGSSSISIVGSNFKVDGASVPYGNLASQTGTLTGSLPSGHSIDTVFHQGGGGYTGTITLMPPVVTVTSNLDDGGPGTLRSMISATPSGYTIDFSVTGTIALTAGQILLEKDVVIAGPGLDQLALDGNRTVEQRIFEVAVGTTVEVLDLTLENAFNPGDAGGAILNRGVLALRNVRVRNNHGDPGGGVFNAETGHLTIRDSTFEDNDFGPGSAIYNAGGEVRATDVSMTRNGSNGDNFGDGGIANASGRMVLIRATLQLNGVSPIVNSGDLAIGASTVTGGWFLLSNSGAAEVWDSHFSDAFGEAAAGIRNSGTLRMTRSSLSRADGYNWGGLSNTGTLILDQAAIFDNRGGSDGNPSDFTGVQNGGTMLVVNSTISRNEGTNGDIPSAVHALAGSQAFIFNSTLVGDSDPLAPLFNSALVFETGSEVTLRGSIVTTDVGGASCYGAGTLNALEGNIASDSSCDNAASSGSILTATPAIGPLQDNGGPTPTHALLPGSPAIDYATNCTYDDDLSALTPDIPIDQDQRGWLRPAGTSCDSGATEFESLALPRVTEHRVIDCTAKRELATLVPGETYDLHLSDVAQPACVGVGVLMDANAPSGDGSLGHSYIPAAGETVSTPYEGESSQPFAMMGDYGWTVAGEIVDCHCDSPARGDLTHPGTHTITSTPCSADSISWTAGNKAAQCETAGGLAGQDYTTKLVISAPEPGLAISWLFGTGMLVWLEQRRRH